MLENCGGLSAFFRKWFATFCRSTSHMFTEGNGFSGPPKVTIMNKNSNIYTQKNVDNIVHSYLSMWKLYVKRVHIFDRLTYQWKLRNIIWIILTDLASDVFFQCSDLKKIVIKKKSKSLRSISKQILVLSFKMTSKSLTSSLTYDMSFQHYMTVNFPLFLYLPESTRLLISSVIFISSKWSVLIFLILVFSILGICPSIWIAKWIQLGWPFSDLR